MQRTSVSNVYVKSSSHDLGLLAQKHRNSCDVKSEEMTTRLSVMLTFLYLQWYFVSNFCQILFPSKCKIIHQFRYSVSMIRNY